MNRRVVVTGMAGVTAFGNDWASVKPRLQAGRNAVVTMHEWGVYDGLNTRLAAPISDFALPAHYPRKKSAPWDESPRCRPWPPSWRWSRRSC